MLIHQTSSLKKPTRVVLLGARGFIGTALEKRLALGSVPVLALGSADVDLASPAALDFLTSVLKPDDSVVMLAALTPDRGRDVATMVKNLAMMQGLCAAISKTGCAHFVYFSSDAVYDSATSRVTEGTPPSPKDLYGVMHLAREVMARTVGVPLLVLRPTLVYGPGDTHNAYGPYRFVRSALQDKKITLFGHGEETRDHVHIDDVTALTLCCLFTGGTGTLNIATGISKSFFEVAEIVANQFEGAVEIAGSPRANPVTHRHYDVTSLVKAFPTFKFMTPVDGIKALQKQMLEKAV